MAKEESNGRSPRKPNIPGKSTKKPISKPNQDTTKHYTYSDEEILAALKKTKGLIYLAAGVVGCSSETIKERAKKVPKIAQAIKQHRGELVDLAEKKLRESIEGEEPDLKSIRYILSTLGKNRGYCERREVRHGGDKNAPPIRSEHMVSIEDLDLPIEVKRALLAAVRAKQEQDKLGDDNQSEEVEDSVAKKSLPSPKPNPSKKKLSNDLEESED